jgi:uncharacterized protein YwgA
MTKQRILLKLVLNQIGLGELPLEAFADRLNLQKRVYLAQLTGTDLGYSYNWYLRGPYCPSLTQDAFTLKDELACGDDEFRDYTLRQEVVEKLKKAEGIWTVPSDVEVSAEIWVELLASLHYLKHIAYWSGNYVTRDMIFAKLRQAKPHFSNRPELITAAWERLREVGLLDRAVLTC